MTLLAGPVQVALFICAFAAWALCWKMTPGLQETLYRATRPSGSDRFSGFDGHDRGQYRRAWVRLMTVRVQGDWPAGLRRRLTRFRLLNGAALMLFMAPWILAYLER